MKLKFLCILLILCMCFGIMPDLLTVFAAGGNEPTDGVVYTLSATETENDTIAFDGSGEITKDLLSPFFLPSSDPLYIDRTQIKYIVIGSDVTGIADSINNTYSIFNQATSVVIKGTGNFRFGQGSFGRHKSDGLSVASERESLEIGSYAFQDAILTAFPMDQIKKVEQYGFSRSIFPVEGENFVLSIKGDAVDINSDKTPISISGYAFSGIKNKNNEYFTSADITVFGTVGFGNYTTNLNNIFGNESSDQIKELNFHLQEEADLILGGGIGMYNTQTLTFDGTGNVYFEHPTYRYTDSALLEAGNLEEIHFENFAGDILFAETMFGPVADKYATIHKAKLSSVLLGENCNVIEIRKNAFDGCKNLKTFDFSKVSGSIGKEAFRNTALTEADLSNVSSISYRAFENVESVSDWSSICVAAQNGILKKLEYSNVFLNTDCVWELVQKEMDGKFALNQDGGYQTLNPSDKGWESSQLGEQNATGAASTQLTKSAKWMDEDKTSAQIEIQAAYAPEQQMDFIFLVDTSTSMELVNDENTAMNKMYQMLSKVADVTDSLLMSEDVDSRVAIISFGDEINESSLGFFEKENADMAAKSIRELKCAGSTDFAVGLDCAVEYIELEQELKRNVSIVFLSDGEANQNEALIALAAKQIENLGVETIGVLYKVNPSDDEKKYIDDACSEYYLAKDTEEFNNAVNRTIYDAFRSFLLTDIIGADFEAVTDGDIKVSGGKCTLSDDGRTVSWDLSGTEPFQTYTMLINAELAKDIEGNYPEKMIPTNDGNAIFTEIGSDDAVNQVASPLLDRILSINVSYQFVGNVPAGVIVPDSVAIDAGTEYTAEKIEAVEGWKFDGWYEDDSCTISFTDGTMLNDDTTLYGKWLRTTTPVEPAAAAYRIEHYKEQLDGSYQIVTEDTQMLIGEIGSLVTAEAKTYEHYHVNADKSIMSGTIIMPNIGTDGAPQMLTLKVCYDLDTYEVKYDLNGGDANDKDYSTATVKHGAAVTVKDAPTKSGYIFEEWSDGATVHKPDDVLTVLENITLTAQWRRRSSGGGSGGGTSTSKFTLHYESNDGTKYKDERYARNSVVQLDKTPVREGYTFIGWYLDKELTNKITDIKMNANKTVYAGWEETKVPEMLNDGDHFAYVVGYPNGMVEPTGNINRAETAAIFFRLLKDEVRDDNLTYISDFEDVETGAWYNASVATMEKLGIIKGRNETEFAPEAFITRAEFAAICARFDTGIVEGTGNFKDLDGHWSKFEVERAVALGWIMGYEDNTFRPDNYITRAEAMTMINRVLKRIPKTESDLLPDMNVWPDNQSGTWYYLAVQEATNSHKFKYKDELHERWTELTEDPDWSRYDAEQ